MNAVPFNTNQHPPAGERVVTILGATGSIGQSTVDLVRRAPEKFRVEALTAHSNVAELAKLARELGAKFAAIADEAHYAALKEALAGSGIEAGAGEGALVEAALRPANWVMAAMSGAAGLKPAMAAAGRGEVVALANKECLVCAGEVFMRHAAAKGATVLPVDSEHNAPFQALGAGRREDLVRVILTASGGPFRAASLAQIENATVEQALKHPNWSMGRKITIDSATMFNKALEIIEAFHLFELRADQIDVLVHPQSIIHGLVEFSDRSVVAQMGAPDMRTPIAHCLAWPARIDGPAARLDLAAIGQLTFEAPDPVRFPALRLVQEALVAGGAAPTQFPRVVMAFPAKADDILLSGMLSGGEALQSNALLVDVPKGQGHMVLYALRPFWRWQTQGSYFLGFNAIINWDHLDAGAKNGAKGD